MKPGPFKEQNFIFRRPEGMTKEECGDLPCHVDKVNGQVIACYELTDEEKEQIAASGKLYLGIKAFPIPPVWLTTVSPFNSIEIQMAPEAVKELQKKGVLPETKQIKPPKKR